MSIDPQTYEAFTDELEKIALMGTLGRAGKSIGRGAKNLLREGWNEGGWMGKGKITKNLPVGMKSQTVGFTALGVPTVMSKRDPIGKSRTRGERGAELTGYTAGGLMGSGAAMKLAPKITGGRLAGLARGATRLGAPIVGGIAAARLLTSPWRKSRQEMARPVLPEDERRRLFQQAQQGLPR